MTGLPAESAGLSKEARRKEINRICYHFDCFLHRMSDYGLVLIDNFNDDRLYTIIKDKFSIGLTGMPYSAEFALKKILGVHVACIGSSNFCSMVDIILGALRFAVNSREDERKEPVAVTLLQQIAPLCLRSEYTGKVEEISVFFSPKDVRAAKYQQKYKELRDYLAAGGVDTRREYFNPFADME